MKKQSPDGLSLVSEDSQLVTGQWWYQKNSGMIVDVPCCFTSDEIPIYCFSEGTVDFIE
jgi:hypothetical protein